MKSAWLARASADALPYLTYLLLFGALVVLIRYSGETFNDGIIQVLAAPFLVGTSICAVWASWKLAFSFAPNIKPRDEGWGYFDVDQEVDRRGIGEQILEYRRKLRRVALSYERQRRNLTVAGVFVATASLSVPIATWAVILSQAFDRQQQLPNAWLLVVSSTTTGALGLAIAVTMLRHVKNNQRPLSDIQERMLDSTEASIAINSPDIAEDLRRVTLELYLRALCTPKFASNRNSDEETPESSEHKLLIEVAGEGLKKFTKD